MELDVQQITSRKSESLEANSTSNYQNVESGKRRVVLRYLRPCDRVLPILFIKTENGTMTSKEA